MVRLWVRRLAHRYTHREWLRLSLDRRRRIRSSQGYPTTQCRAQIATTARRLQFWRQKIPSWANPRAYRPKRPGIAAVAVRRRLACHASKYEKALGTSAVTIRIPL